MRSDLARREIAEADDRAPLELFARVIRHLRARALDPKGAEVNGEQPGWLLSFWKIFD